MLSQINYLLDNYDPIIKQFLEPYGLENIPKFAKLLKNKSQFDKKIYLLHGNGNNGKTTFMHLMHKSAGNECACFTTDKLIIFNENLHEGKELLIIDDSSDIDESIKELQYFIREKQIKYKIIISSNLLPNNYQHFINDIEVINFTSTFNYYDNKKNSEIVSKIMHNHIGDIKDILEKCLQIDELNY